ncbi:hypothetical protein D9757_006481 [Collybiopsis confluens]|uniref:Uncharacterized protein n=1 Tax=Collybiopsis confluens TaxID=2823264 RepID=A0A8H5HK42_9AGAR|nr:hypothetical protein D9757_006481 [Collybiopsis confluens]
MYSTLAAIFIGLPALYTTLWLAWLLLRSQVLSRYTGIPVIQNLGDAQPLKKKLKGTAVVCGGSIAGLLAARVCHDLFENVLIIEPEAWLNTEDGMRRFSWEQTGRRSRVMQYYSVQGLQVLCYHGLSKLFPDLEKECNYSGIVVASAEPTAAIAGVPLRRPAPEGKALPYSMEASRAAFETLIRQVRIHFALSDIRYKHHYKASVTGIVLRSDDPSRIGKVLVRQSVSQSSRSLEIDVSLVIDCTGITRAGSKWLAQAGYGTADAYPKGKLPLKDLKISLDQKLHYYTLICDVPPSVLKKMPFPGNIDRERSVYAFLEDKLSEANGRRIFSLNKWEGPRVSLFVGQYKESLKVEYPSFTSIRSLLHDLVGTAPVPEWVFQCVDILEEAQVEINYSHVRIPPSTYIRYHQGINLPSNFVASGDSIMSVDPLFGQGATKALLGAVSIRTVLSKLGYPETIPGNFSELYFKEQHDRTHQYWQGTRMIAYGHPFTIPIPGDDLKAGTFIRWYSGKLRSLAVKDMAASSAIWNSTMGFGTPVDIFHPALLIKTFWRLIYDS